MSHVDDKTLKRKMVVLEPFVNESFDFSGNEHIEKVSPVAIIAHKKVGKNRTISLTDKDDAIEAMKYELKNHRNLELLSVKLRFFINRPGKKSKSVTVVLRPPEGTRIPSQEWQNIIEEYLHEQGVLLV